MSVGLSMSEVADAPLQAAESAGTLLRRAREAAGLHVAALAVALKVPVRKLEALEDDRFADMGDAVFVRALASSVCRTLKVDAQPILERLPRTSAPRLVKDTDGINTPFRAPADGPQPTWLDTVRQPVPLAVIALVIGALVIFFLPARFTDEKATVTAGTSASQAPAHVTVPVPAQVVPTQPAQEPPATHVAAAPMIIPAAPQANAAPAPSASQAAPVSVPVAAAVAAPASAPQATTGIVVLRTQGESWVEVVDAKGNAAVRKIMAAGETAGASGVLPLSVTVGRADMTRVEVRGKPFDLKPVSRDNVARFEVK